MQGTHTVGVGVPVGPVGVMVGVEVMVGVCVMVRVGVIVRVGVKVRVEVGVKVDVRVGVCSCLLITANRFFFCCIK